MKVIIQKPDLDTCLTALILGVKTSDEIIVSKGDAEPEDINNKDVLCIEAGGSGLVELNNFDHHTEIYFYPACKQAYEKAGNRQGAIGERMERLVEYVCKVDERIEICPQIGFPSLSNIFSGMLLVERSLTSQFFKGIEILKKALDDNIDPFATMPDTPEWRVYKDAKMLNHKMVQQVIKSAEFFKSRYDLKIGYVESDFIGGIGELYAEGCAVVIMYNPSFGEPPIRKFTIAGNGIKVYELIPRFNRIEDGWGGRKTIIGSPRSGTMLNKNKVIEMVIDNL